MRTPRFKKRPDEGAAWYHCISRTVNGEWLFGDVEKEVMRKQLWKVADYCGLLIGTYALMSNHFHLLVRIPKRAQVTDEELLRRYAVLYPDLPEEGYSRLAAIREMLAENGCDAERWRRRHLAMMGDVSPFMQLFKQRYSVWFNRTHNRFGTLWCERYKSVLIEDSQAAVKTFAEYIDLNAVRAGIVRDPKDYRFCGYGEAFAGSRAARAGLTAVVGVFDWTQAQAEYRQELMVSGARTRDGKASITPELLKKVLAEKGTLPMPEVLRCRLRYMTEAAIFGSQAFVTEHLELYRLRTGRGMRLKPKPLPPFTDWLKMTALRVRSSV